MKSLGEKLRGERGVALMLTLSALVILTTIIVEFAYNTHVAYEMAANDRDRLKAYYLARSAFNFSRFELATERRLRSQFAAVLQNVQGSGFTSDPLCKQFPFSTDLLKGVVSEGVTAAMAPKTVESLAAPKDESGGAETKPAQKKEGEAPSSSATEEGGFLDFDGSFEVSCDTEERKINLNVFRQGETGASPGAITPGAPPTSSTAAVNLYLDQKNLLFSLMSQKEFEPFFKGPDEIRKVVNAIADWADPDDQINELPGVSGGSEDSIFSGPEYTYKSKNGKYASVAELLLIPGIGDDLYNLLAPQVTVYGANTINLCQASDDVVRAFVIRTAGNAAGATPIRPDDQEKLQQIILAVRLACVNPNPQPAQVAAAITALVGAGAGSNLAAQISTTNRFYSIKATGTVADTNVTLRAVVDTQNSNPNLWRTLYFRVE